MPPVRVKHYAQALSATAGVQWFGRGGAPKTLINNNIGSEHFFVLPK